MRRVRGTNGNDTLSASYYHVAHEILGEGGDDSITGSIFGDILRGGTGKDTIRGEQGDDLIEGGADADVIDGGDDIDTATYESSDAGVAVNLRTGLGSGGHAQGDTLRNIENLTGSRFADKLFGDAAANVLIGGAGSDTLFGDDGNDTLEGGVGADALDGGNNIDTASYSDSREGVKVNLAAGKGGGGSAEGDTLKNIENVTGSTLADTLIGDARDNVLDGGAGDDFLDGGAGRDTLIGGDGIDTASYAGSNVGVGVSLGEGFAADDVNGDGLFDNADDVTGDGVFDEADATDTISQVENVVGSVYDDLIFGDSQANVLQGGDGNDQLNGWGGDDTLVGGNGADRLHGSSDNDWLEGGAGGDDIGGSGGIDTASYASSNAGVFIDLDSGLVDGGHAHGDTLSGIENIEGSAHGDVLRGTNSDNVIKGGAGDDIIQGRSGVDEIWGGAGDDTFVFDQSDDAGPSILPWNIEAIGDFTAGGTEDELDLTLAGTGYTSLDDVLANSTEMFDANNQFAGTMIDLGPSGGVLLAGVEMSDLTVQDFNFA